MPAHGQDNTCGDAPPTRLTGAHHASVVAGQVVPVYSTANGDKAGDMLADIGPISSSRPHSVRTKTWRRHIAAAIFTITGFRRPLTAVTVVEPFQFTPKPPVPLGAPNGHARVIRSTPSEPRSSPCRPPAIRKLSGFAAWDWATDTAMPGTSAARSDGAANCRKPTGVSALSRRSISITSICAGRQPERQPARAAGAKRFCRRAGRLRAVRRGLPERLGSRPRAKAISSPPTRCSTRST